MAIESRLRTDLGLRVGRRARHRLAGRARTAQRAQRTTTAQRLAIAKRLDESLCPLAQGSKYDSAHTRTACETFNAQT